MRKRFSLKASVSSDNLAAMKPVLQGFAAKAVIRPDKNELIVEAALEGNEAKELNRSLLSALRRVEKRTRLRSEWTSDDGTVYKFFDYVLKKVSKA